LALSLLFYFLVFIIIVNQISSHIIYLHLMPSFLLHHPLLPDITSLSSNAKKLCYLAAWQTLTDNNTKMMKFTNNKPICIDTGVSCSISSNKQDFLTFTETSSTVLKGIGSGLPVVGIGTVKWIIVDDNGDDIVLHLHNTLDVPDIPMCLLSPHHMAQQTTLSSDGFNCTGPHGILTFAGFHRTIYYNQHNNLPILFLASDFTSLPSSENSTPTNNNMSTSTTALLGTTVSPTPMILLSPVFLRLNVSFYRLINVWVIYIWLEYKNLLETAILVRISLQ
jgi:hypothetical protein